MIRLDLHTHSEASKDGGITPTQFARILREEKLDMVAITDHDRIDFALGMQKALGEDKIIVGEEITTNDGEVIGLFLKKKIEPHMSLQDTIEAIKFQGGIVYVPHPFETVRKGVQLDALNAVADDIDIIEVHNGRAVFQNFSEQAMQWAQEHHIAMAASSDAHGYRGLGRTFSRLRRTPTRTTIVDELNRATLRAQRPPLYTLFYPKLNRLKHIVTGRG